VFAPSDELREYTSSNYAFGPEYVVRGIVVNDQSVIFDQRSSNYTKLSLLSEEGSCPFLQSRRQDGIWIEHGKILHLGLGEEKEYVETIDFEGLRTKFRIDEREPETAYIDQVALDFELDDGTRYKLEPQNWQLKESDGIRLALSWGNVLEFDFLLPERVNANNVESSRLSVRGFYTRYPPVAELPHVGGAERTVSSERAPQFCRVAAQSLETADVRFEPP
jgi:hypothetical protein